MFDDIEVNQRVSERHPEIQESDVATAWANVLVVIERSGTSLPDTVLVAVGFDSNGRFIEMVGSVMENGIVHIFHAMTPPTKRTLQEVGIGR